ncbi:uncharacterized protein LOC144152348 isoform X2 [Haemaphysalis longicornis]
MFPRQKVFCKVYNACRMIDAEPKTSQVMDCVIKDVQNETGTWLTCNYALERSPDIKAADRKLVLCVRRLHMESLPIQAFDDVIALSWHVARTYG